MMHLYRTLAENSRCARLLDTLLHIRRVDRMDNLEIKLHSETQLIVWYSMVPNINCSYLSFSLSLTLCITLSRSHTHTQLFVIIIGVITLSFGVINYTILCCSCPARSRQRHVLQRSDRYTHKHAHTHIHTPGTWCQPD